MEKQGTIIILSKMSILKCKKTSSIHQAATTGKDCIEYHNLIFLPKEQYPAKAFFSPNGKTLLSVEVNYSLSEKIMISDSDELKKINWKEGITQAARLNQIRRFFPLWYWVILLLLVSVVLLISINQFE